MALTERELALIDGLLSPPDADNGAVADLRSRLPALSFTRCDASDVDADEPFRSYPRFHLYLVDGASHCWQITSDPDRATGLLVARTGA